jgi:chorismate dehydratase
MARVRLGAVGYLNARPLVYHLDASPRFDLRFDVPSRCAELLHEGAIDLGLIPSIEYNHPITRTEYAVVPDLAIASNGPVASVAIYTRRDIRDVRSVALDTSSRTSVALVRVLCQRVFRITPRLEHRGPDLTDMLSACDAALIIGDNALVQDGDAVTRKHDLGEIWMQMAGLPFVYAFWAGRRGAVGPHDVEALQQARDLGLRHSDEIAREYFAASPDRQAMGARYLRDNIKYSLGEQERAGLELFYRYAVEAGVINCAEPLRLFEK